MEPELIRARDVARRLDISLRTVWNWTARGILPPPLRMGHVTRWRRSEIDAYLILHRGFLPPSRPA
jgi:predicted DNA-binding transcriptional regulator AlpA